MKLVKPIEQKCNICGKTFDDYDYFNKCELSTWAGYGSKYDGALVHISFCVDCMDKLIESCKISPIEETSYERYEGRTH